MAPFYSSGKASYLGGLTPVIAVLGAAGLHLLTRQRLMRAAVYGVFACWALASYLGYFVV